MDMTDLIYVLGTLVLFAVFMAVVYAFERMNKWT